MIIKDVQNWRITISLYDTLPSCVLNSWFLDKCSSQIHSILSCIAGPPLYYNKAVHNKDDQAHSSFNLFTPGSNISRFTSVAQIKCLFKIKLNATIPLTSSWSRWYTNTSPVILFSLYVRFNIMSFLYFYLNWIWNERGIWCDKLLVIYDLIFKLNVFIILKLNCVFENNESQVHFSWKNMAVCQQLQSPTATSATF